MSDSKLRVGLIGAGGIARAHARHFQENDNVELVAASDPVPAALEKMEEEYGIKQLFTDYNEMIAAGCVDAVSVCTPNALHADPTIVALEAGIHALVEKPLAMTVDEAEKMCAAAEKSGKILSTAFQWRFDPRAQYMRDQVKAGTVGDPLYVRVQAKRRRGIPNWGVFYSKEAQGGGPMIDIGVHMLEMAHYICGAPTPERVSARTWTYIGDKDSHAVKANWAGWNYQDYDVEDLAVGMIHCANNCTIVIESSFAGHLEENNVMNVEIMGTKGGVRFDPVALFTDQNGYLVNTEPAWLPKGNTFQHKIDHFVAVCRGEVANEAPGTDGLKVQQMLNGVYDAAEANREIIL